MLTKIAFGLRAVFLDGKRGGRLWRDMPVVIIFRICDLPNAKPCTERPVPPFQSSKHLPPDIHDRPAGHFNPSRSNQPPFQTKFLPKRAQPLLVLKVLIVQGAETPYF
jgi:hypothetical protein